MTQFSANLGFLWTELSLPNAIRAAHLAGFEAVECHWPYDTNPEFVNDVLHETGLRMLGLNTTRGNHLEGDNGLSALIDQKPQARAAIDQAVAYAVATKCPKIHVMAGFASGDEAHETFIGNLRYACNEAEKHDLTILIEPLNEYDAPGYFLQSTDQALKIIQEIDQSRSFKLSNTYCSANFADKDQMCSDKQELTRQREMHSRCGTLDRNYCFSTMHMAYHAFKSTN